MRAGEETVRHAPIFEGVRYQSVIFVFPRTYRR